jgi:MarR family protein
VSSQAAGLNLNATVNGPPAWTFLSNHGAVLLTIARNPDVTLREVAALVGITERTVQRIVVDLEEAQYVERVRTGRRNRYKIRSDLPLRHPISAHVEIGSLLELLTGPHQRNGQPGSPPGIATEKKNGSCAPEDGRTPTG